MNVNPKVFFKFHERKFIAWNYGAHEQFELTLPYFQRLYALETGEDATPDARIDDELQCANLISPAYAAERWGWDCLSHIFHVGTNTSAPGGDALPTDDNTKNYVDYCESLENDPSVIEKVAGTAYALPAPDTSALRNISLWDALLLRKTSRSFTGESISLDIVGNILHATFGAVHGKERNDLEAYGAKSYGYRRTSPSGGCLQTAEPYIVNLTVDTLPKGVYHYHSLEHKLTRLESTLTAADLGPLLAGQHFAGGLAFAVFIVARFDKMWWKYPHSRAYRVALMDIGHLSQTFHLACTGYALKSWLTAAFYDEEISKRLKLHPDREAPLLMVGAGAGDGSPISPDIADYLKQTP